MSATDHENAKQDYLNGMKYKELAEKYNVSINTIRSWKQRYGWNRKDVHTKSKKMCTQKTDAPVPSKKTKTKIKDNTEGPELTEKQVLFVAEYLTDFNATRAAMAVGYSKKSARQIGHRLLTNAYIQEEIQRQTELVTNNLGITKQRVLLEYLRMAFTDITQYISWGQREVPVMNMFGPVVDKETGEPVMKTVNYVDFKESDKVDGSLISEVKQGRDGVSIKLYDKFKALEKLEKYLDLLPDKYKRRIEEEKLKLQAEEQKIRVEKLKLEIEKAKNPDGDEVEDDGFMDALKASAKEVWSDADET